MRRNFLTVSGSHKPMTKTQYSRKHPPALLLVAFAFLAWFGVPSVTAATHLSQHGITWTFDRDYRSGQFANGDHWVVGPVKIVKITPADSNLKDGTDLHGAVLNPMPSLRRPYVQSWDSRIGSSMKYDRAQNVARKLPLTIPAGSSLVSSVSFPSPRSGLCLSDAAVLTVLGSAPPAGSFRPPYAGTDKTIPGNVANLNLSVFRSLPPINGTSGFSFLNNAFKQPMIDVVGQWNNSAVKNANAGPNYGRDIAYQAGSAALYLNLNVPAEQKKALLIRYVQRGIDTYGLAKAGMVWAPNGGHNNGRKLPMLIAAKALGHADMLAWSDGQKHLIFQEDMQHFYVSPTDVSTKRTKSGSIPYARSMIGMPEWASNPVNERDQTGSEWNKPYRINNGSVNTGVVLAVEMMGLRKAWNWEPLFDYITNRYWPTEGITPTTKVTIPPPHRLLWTNYRYITPSDFNDDNVATEVWQNLEIPLQKGSFTVAFDTVASASKINGVIGLSSGGATADEDLIASLRYAPSGRFEALNGKTYQASKTLNYSPGVKYRVVATINIAAKNYSVTITPAGGKPVQIADRWKLRDQSIAAHQMDNLSFFSTGGYHAVLSAFINPTLSQLASPSL